MKHKYWISLSSAEQLDSVFVRLLYEYFGDIRTVDVTVRRIREKIERDTSAPKLLITKRGVGYYLSGK